MKLNELKTGMVAVLRNGEVYRVLCGSETGDYLMSNIGGIPLANTLLCKSGLEGYTEDLNFIAPSHTGGPHEFDIVKVYKPDGTLWGLTPELNFSHLVEIFNRVEEEAEPAPALTEDQKYDMQDRYAELLREAFEREYCTSDICEGLNMKNVEEEAYHYAATLDFIVMDMEEKAAYVAWVNRNNVLDEDDQDQEDESDEDEARELGQKMLQLRNSCIKAVEGDDEEDE